MTAPAPHPATTPRTDAEAWASPVEHLVVSEASVHGLSSTVAGKRLSGPLQGFGQMWQKTFRVRLDGADPELTPQQVVTTWKAEFPSFWPRGNTFYAPLAGIRPGEVALLSVAAAGPVKLHTGVMVVFADDEAFTLMTPEGHMLSAWITFSAFRDVDGVVVAQAQALERASDPLFELSLVLGGHRVNNRFWQRTVANLAARFGVSADPVTEITKVDRRRQWRYFGNVRHNVGFRSALYSVAAPVRWIRRGR